MAVDAREFPQCRIIPRIEPAHFVENDLVPVFISTVGDCPLNRHGSDGRRR